MAQIIKQTVLQLLDIWFLTEWVPKLLEKYKDIALRLAPSSRVVQDMLSRGIIYVPSSRGRQTAAGMTVGTARGGRSVRMEPTIRQYIRKLRPEISFPWATLKSSIPESMVAQFGWIRNRPGRDKGKFMRTKISTHKFNIVDTILGEKDVLWKVDARKDRSFPILNPAPGIYARVMLKEIKAHWVWEEAQRTALFVMTPELHRMGIMFAEMWQAAQGK